MFTSQKPFQTILHNVNKTIKRKKTLSNKNKTKTNQSVKAIPAKQLPPGGVVKVLLSSAICEIAMFQNENREEIDKLVYYKSEQL